MVHGEKEKRMNVGIWLLEYGLINKQASLSSSHSSRGFDNPAIDAVGGDHIVRDIMTRTYSRQQEARDARRCSFWQGENVQTGLPANRTDNNSDERPLAATRLVR